MTCDIDEIMHEGSTAENRGSSRRGSYQAVKPSFFFAFVRLALKKIITIIIITQISNIENGIAVKSMALDIWV